MQWIRRESVLIIALLLAAVSAFIVPPDKEYIGYIDFRVLALLFDLMVVVKGFEQAGLLDRVIDKVLGRIRSSRALCAVLIALCFFSSMLMTNDVALLTFVPLALLTLSRCKMEKQAVKVVVLQTMAANLGSMFTPIGNPQNLYLFSVSGMGAGEFFLLMLPYTAVSLLTVMAGAALIPKGSVSVDGGAGESALDRKGLILFGILFVLNLLVVFRVLPYLPVLAVTVLLPFVGKRAEPFKKADYALLLTFVGFFVFVGNMGRIPLIRGALASLIEGRTVLTAAVLSQAISNVPAALLLSGFTGDYAGLIVGTNIGGLGTLIASMASLISYKLYAKSDGANKGRYLAVFTAMNVAGLLILYALNILIG